MLDVALRLTARYTFSSGASLQECVYVSTSSRILLFPLSLQMRTVSPLVILAVFYTFVFAVSRYGWDWTGFSNVATRKIVISTTNGITTATELQLTKTLWDWLGLLAVLVTPVVVGLGVAWI